MGLPDEGDHVLWEQTALRVEGVPVAFFVPACSGQVVFDGGFEGLFCVLTGHQAISGLRKRKAGTKWRKIPASHSVVFNEKVANVFV
ncbi:MAG: hypothetical protein B1H02_04860 [Candidatus Latescibacteria bacterium 4484_107]|nr:MAG: hypothetical protein B1H02_04860 [Candidatus Latescibacteria bacterium 4484_107]